VTAAQGGSNDRRPFVLAIGDSLTAGYGLAARDAFPAQLETLLRARYPDARVQNAGVSGDTTASALARLPRLLSSLSALPDLAIVALGANDLLRAVSPQQTRIHLDALLAELGRCTIPVLIAAMDAPRFLGGLARLCDAVYADLAAKHGVPVWPFFPPGVLGNRALTLPDRLHPNARAISMVANHMLAPVLDALRVCDPATEQAA
jgi:acyl-CoA thioesterase-1